MKKYLNIKSLIFGSILVLSMSCDSVDQDVEAVVSTADYPVASFQLMNSEVGDRDGGIVRIKVTLDKMLTAGVSFSAIQTGGSATEGEDFDIMGASVLAFSNEAYVDIQINPDIEIEGDETIIIQMVAPSLANRYLLNPTTVFPSFTINIKDYVFCLWTLDGADAFGDGWNGASIRLTSEGQSIDYAVEEVSASFDIPVTKNEDYTFEFISGDWDGEVSYTLTGPDGTTYTKNAGTYPGSGEITNGVSTCD